MSKVSPPWTMLSDFRYTALRCCMREETAERAQALAAFPLVRFRVWAQRRTGRPDAARGTPPRQSQLDSQCGGGSPSRAPTPRQRHERRAILARCSQMRHILDCAHPSLLPPLGLTHTHAQTGDDRDNSHLALPISSARVATSCSALATDQTLLALALSNLASQSGTAWPALRAILMRAGAHSLS